MHKRLRTHWTIPSLVIALLLATLSFVPAVAAGPPVNRGPATHIVVFHDGVDADAASLDLVGRHGLTREFVYKNVLRGASFIIPPGRLADVQSDPRVAFVERNQIVQAFPQVVPTGINRIDADLNSPADIDGVDVRVDVDIAIIDTGIDLDHPDLNVYAHVNCARGGPFGGDCKTGGSEGDDGNGHGTHVAGTAAALDNGIGVVGVAPGARLWAVRVLDNNGSGWMSWIIGGIDWVTDNADHIDVANMSLGCECDSAALDIAIASSVAEGIVYTVAAGNNMKNAATFSPANHPDVITVSAIADFDGVGGGSNDQTVAFSICTETEDDSFACFSNYGEVVEIAAPGVNILSTWNNGGYYTISGTSMASPHAAGAAALNIAINGKPTDKAGADAIRDALIAAGTPQSDPDGFTGDSDGHPEPLLNVANTALVPQVLTADAGPDQTVNDDDGDGVENVTLDGSGSGGTIASYEWKDGSTVLGTGVSITASFDVAGSPHTVTLTVTDNDGLTDTDDVIVTVNPPQSPTANAGPDQTLSDNDGNGWEDVTLDGSDPGGTIASYEWKEGTTVLGTTASITASFDVAGSPHTVTLTVTDTNGLTDTDDVIVTVNPNQSPTANAGPDQPVSDSDGNGSEDVTLDGSGSSDSDGSISTYEWFEGGVPIATGVTPVVAFALGTHTVTLTVTDNGGASSSDTVVITVSEPPATATKVIVDSITYATEGGRNSNKHLLITVALLDDFGQDVGGASVSIELFRDNSFVGAATGTTGTNGTVSFNLKNAKSGCYTTTVTDVTAAGLTWDANTPPNGFCK